MDESCNTDGAENDESLIVTSPDGIGVPLLVGKDELALNLVNGKSDRRSLEKKSRIATGEIRIDQRGESYVGKTSEESKNSERRHYFSR